MSKAKEREGERQRLKWREHSKEVPRAGSRISWEKAKHPFHSSDVF